jgi:hypothetical protein
MNVEGFEIVIENRNGTVNCVHVLTAGNDPLNNLKVNIFKFKRP